MDSGEAFHSEVVTEEQSRADDDDGHRGSFHADGETADDVGGGAGEGGFGDGLDGAVAALGIVLRDPDEEEGGDQADDSAEEEIYGLDAGAVEHLVDDAREAGEGEGGGDVEPAVEGSHGVFGVVGFDDGDADDGGDQVDGVDHQREEDALDAEDRVEGGAEDHGTDVFGGGGLEDVGSTAGAVAYVVADEVGDDGGVAGIVFGDAGFDFADEIGTDVGGLGVDASAELCEEGDERGSEAEAYEFVDDVAGIVEATKEEEEDADTDEGEGDDDEAGDGSSTEGGLQRLVEGRACGGGGADVRADGDVHAGEAGEAGADGSDEEADDGPGSEVVGVRREAVADEDDDGKDDGHDADGAVLAGEKGFGSFTDGVGDDAHFGSSGVSGEDDAGEDEGRDEGENADAESNPQPDVVAAVDGCRDRCGATGLDILKTEENCCDCAEVHGRKFLLVPIVKWWCLLQKI